jgi:DNA mismatch repair protein MutL
METQAPRIKQLEATVAERIAAGEVIERPASVVKELVENSIDAGATEIQILVHDGGKALIEVLDNGHGIAAEDLALALERHATSKLTSLADFESLQTLGFRGEALPSIAAVSDLSILSRQHDQAFEVRAQGARQVSAVTFGHFLGSPHGTRIQARGLFSQVPARLKFLKSQGAEVAQISEWLERLALAHPTIGFKLLSDDRVVLTLRPESEQSRVQAVLSPKEVFPIITRSSDQSYQGFSIRLHWLQGLSTPQTRKLMQVVNGRALRDRLLQQALIMPFRQTLLPGQFPALALYIDINPSEIDVNVHPTKTEIRFLDSRKIFHAVESLVSNMILQEGAPGFVPERLASSGLFGGVYRAQENTAPLPFAQPQAPLPTPMLGFGGRMVAPAPAPVTNAEGTTSPTNSPLQGARYSGTLFQTYLLFELPGELVLIDQHAAHERIRYESLKSRVLEKKQKAQVQALLIPEAVHLQDDWNGGRLESKLPLLADLGFEAELFSEDTLLFRGVPSDWGTDSLRPRLKNLVDRLLHLEPGTSQPLAMDETLFEALASEACHSAVRAGDRLQPEQAQSLADELFQCQQPWNCPHGRPTVVRVPEGRFEEWFHRRVP